MHSGSLKAAIWSGILATFVATVTGYWFDVICLPRLDFATWNGALLVPNDASITFMWSVGVLQLFGGGVVMAILYGFYVQMYLPGPGWVRGMIWGAVLAVLVGLTVVPLLYGGGPFGSDWDGRTVVAIIVWHLLWGNVLGSPSTRTGPPKTSQ